MIAEELAERFLVPADAMALDEGDEVLRPVWILVKLQRPPPEMRIFSPGALAWSMTSTRRPRLPASMAHIMPAAPAPMITTSCFSATEASFCFRILLSGEQGESQSRASS
jgi:hypothetical protein